MTDDEAFTETTGALARAAHVSQPTVRKYTDLGLLPYIVASNRIRLYQPQAAQTVKRILAQRIAKRGRSRG